MSDQLARLRGRIGALSLHASGKTNTAPARAFMDRFELEIDPNGTLSPSERARRAELARRLYFTRLAYKSAKVRHRRKSDLASAIAKALSVM